MPKATFRGEIDFFVVGNNKGDVANRKPMPKVTKKQGRMTFKPKSHFKRHGKSKYSPQKMSRRAKPQPRVESDEVPHTGRQAAMQNNSRIRIRKPSKRKPKKMVEESESSEMDASEVAISSPDSGADSVQEQLSDNEIVDLYDADDSESSSFTDADKRSARKRVNLSLGSDDFPQRRGRKRGRRFRARRFEFESSEPEVDTYVNAGNPIYHAAIG